MQKNQNQESKKTRALLFAIAFSMAFNFKLLMDVSKKDRIIANLAGAGQEYIEILEKELLLCQKP